MSEQSFMELTFTVTEDDVRRFTRYHLLHAPRVRLWAWGFYAALILWPAYQLLTTDFELPAEHPLFRTMPLIAAAISALVCAAIGPPFFLVATWLSAKQWSRRNIGVTGEQSAAISPAEVLWTWDTGRSTQEWSAFQQIVGTRDYILFYRGLNFAQLIPRRAFATPAAAEVFLQCATEWHAAAVSGSRTESQC
jgi:hypothetical protein